MDADGGSGGDGEDDEKDREVMVDAFAPSVGMVLVPSPDLRDVLDGDDNELSEHVEGDGRIRPSRTDFSGMGPPGLLPVCRPLARPPLPTACRISGRAETRDPGGARGS